MEEILNFEIIKPKQLSEEDLEKRRTATRNRVAKHREKRRKENNPAAKLAATWQSNLDALDDSERDALLEQAAQYKRLTDRMFADDFSAYRPLKEFIQQTGGTVRDWVPVIFADEVDLERYAASDSVFIKTGIRTRIWQMFWVQFLKRLITAADIEPETLQEVQAELAPYLAYLQEDRPAIPAIPVGAKQRTKNEEIAHQAWVEDRRVAQEVFDKGLRQHLLDQLNAEHDDVLEENP